MWDWEHGEIIQILRNGFEQGHGFIRPDFGRPDVMYYVDNGQRLEASSSGELPPILTGNGLDRLPRRGDRVVFIWKPSARGPRTVSWGYEADIEL